MTGGVSCALAVERNDGFHGNLRNQVALHHSAHLARGEDDKERDSRQRRGTMLEKRGWDTFGGARLNDRRRVPEAACHALLWHKGSPSLEAKREAPSWLLSKQRFALFVTSGSKWRRICPGRVRPLQLKRMLLQVSLLKTRRASRFCRSSQCIVAGRYER